MHSIFLMMTGLAVSGGLLHAQESQRLNDHLLSQLRSEAARNHPAAVAGKLRAHAAGRDVAAVRLWNDPMAGLGFMAAEKMMRASDGDVMVAVEQSLPKPGWFDAQRGKAEAMHRAAIENATVDSLAVGAEAARAAIELALADESVDLQRAQVEWLTAMAKNAEQMTADPMSNNIEAMRMTTELAREQQMLDAARRNRDGLARQLNLTLGRSIDGSWPSLKLPDRPLPVPVATTEIGRITRANPKVRSMIEMTGAARAETRMADRERLPEVSLGIDSRMYSGGDYRSTTLGVKMSMPWFNDHSYQAKISAAKDREAVASREVEAMRREVAVRVLAAATEAANAAAQARAYAGDVRDKAEKTTQTIEAAWISSKAPLTDLLDASRALFAIRLEQRRMIAMQLAALEELHTLVPDR